jgi:hypothetical protein
MRSTRFWGKLTANLPPKLQTAEEARLSLQLVNSWRTKLLSNFLGKLLLAVRTRSVIRCFQVDVTANDMTVDDL